MTQTGFARRRDANEKEIVDALVSVGCAVTRLNEKGVPDLLTGFNARTFLMEVKAGRNGLTPDQTRWVASWRGAPVPIVRSIEDALRVIGLHITALGMYSYCPHHPQCDGREPRCCCADKHILSTYPRSQP